MTNEQIAQSLDRLNNDGLIQNYIAQANARYILLNTAEQPDSFPQYSIGDDRLNMLALQYLNLGCSWAENERLVDAMTPLERGANILEAVHGAQTNQNRTSNYYGTIAALAYYVSFQYSKSFILIGKFESTTNIARCIRYFLLRDFHRLNETLYEIIVDPQYSDEAITGSFEEDGSLRIYEVVIAKALDGFVKYLLTGNQEVFEAARRQLRDLKEVAEIENDPGIWWVIRLLLLISDGFRDSSIWNVLSGFFDMDEPKVKQYIRALVYMQPKGIYELFITQRQSLAKVLNEDENGCIVSIPTSSGKTRIAEIAILHSIQENPDCKILYIAPFRSLAFEIENSMERIFENAGISISHLYGGSTYSRLDEMAIEEATLVIATPEKAKAILRGNSEFISQIKLAIIDEGHLLGDDKRSIVNEIFYEELRKYMGDNNGRFLVLSAVLPNAEDLAEWLTGSKEAVYREDWRPSDERLGILEWYNGAVNLNWESRDKERSSFNNKFITRQELPLRGRQRVPRYYPADKNEAVAAAAYKIRTLGPVLIYVGVRRSVFVMAKAYLKALGDGSQNHVWKHLGDWRAFELACIETYGEDNNNWLEFARKGILCHNSDLHADVRLPLERLMRSDKPLVIISTSTLGQGVNLGVSTVIFSTLSQSGAPIKPRDFWNIAGRAGRAFVDHEGKILVARETTGMSKAKRDADTAYVRKYFDKQRIDIAQSGIMLLIRELKEMAGDNEVEFDLLLTLISENRISEIGGNTQAIEEVLDWIDDTLLSLLLNHNPFGEVDISWIEEFFSCSLAAIQAARERGLTSQEVTHFLQSRIEGIIETVGNDRNRWHSIVKSGIPMKSNLMLEDRLSEILEVVGNYVESGRTVEDKIELLGVIESIISDLPVLLEDGNFFVGPQIDRIRELWLKGVSNSEIFKLEVGMETVTRLYAFSLPWVLNGIAKKMRNLDWEEEAEVVEELAVLVEAGLPSILKVKIYQAGIRSRVCAGEIGDLFNDDDHERSISGFRRELIENRDYYKDLVSDVAGEWLDLLSRNADRRRIKVRKVGPFNFGNVHKQTTTLLAKSINGKQFLMSSDLKFIWDGKGDVDFTSVNNIPGIEFRYSKRHNDWRMKNINPYVQVER